MVINTSVISLFEFSTTKILTSSYWYLNVGTMVEKQDNWDNWVWEKWF